MGFLRSPTYNVEQSDPLCLADPAIGIKFYPVSLHRNVQQSCPIPPVVEG